MALDTYLPQDRLRALALDSEGALPLRAQGAALFADISGFTAMTEALGQSHGERGGIEALSQRINAVYDALVAEVERWGGSVVGFAGDAITVWFDATAGEALQRAVVCAQALQRAMQPFPQLMLKVGVAAGPARRFVIPLEPAGRLDVLAGATVTRAAQGEHLAQAGEVLLDQAAAAQLGVPKRTTREADSGERFFVLDPQWRLAQPPAEPPQLPPPTVPAERLQAWVLPFVYQRETHREHLFVTDLRPATALFLHFGGLDYDRDEQAPAALARLVGTAQACIEQQGGTLLELTLGDKGSYLYANFGAARVHEDDPYRAVRTALALREAFAQSAHPVRMGLSCGTLRVGGYGSATRQSFGAIGDEVNAAARLMGLAQGSEILISGRLRQALGAGFSLEARPPMAMKGKAEPIPVFAVLGMHVERAVRLQEPVPELPLVGRQSELAWLGRKLSVAQRGQGQVLGLCAEAGMGKSRLIAEGLRMAHRQQFSAYGGHCAVEGVPTPYLVWQPIWAALFDFDPAWPLRKQLRTMESQLREHAPNHVDALPLLSRVLGVQWPDTVFTSALSPQDSKSLLEALLLDCLASFLREADEDGLGLMLVLEDLHAIDPLSLDLLVHLARACAQGPMLMLLSYRPLPDGRPPAVVERLTPLHHFDAVTLDGLDAAQTEQLIRAKLAALFPERVGAVPAHLIGRVTAQAQGNPFYVEELLNYLHDRGLDPRNLAPQEALVLPASLHSLVLSRIDQLQPVQQQTLKVASVIGRLFAAADLQGYHPAVGDSPSLRHTLDELDRLGFTPQAVEQPELSYLFKHLVTLEAGYQSMSQPTRTALHGEFARYLEARSAEMPDLHATQLAHHYASADLHEKACHYLVMAGEQAAANFANEQALSCFERALLWLPTSACDVRWKVLLRCEALHDLMGLHTARRTELAELERLVPSLPDPALRHAELLLRRAKLEIDVSQYAPAQACARDALAQLDATHNNSPEADRLRVDALLLQARAQFYSGEATASRPHLDQALALAKAQAYVRGTYNTLAQVGLVHWQSGDFDAARGLLLQALTHIEAAGDLRRQIDILNNLGVVARGQGHTAQALQHYGQAQALARRIGDRSGEAMLLNNQGTACLDDGDYHQAGEHAARAAALFAEVNEPSPQGMSLITLGESLRALGQFDEALATATQAMALLKQCGSRHGEATVLENIGQIHRAKGQWAPGLRCTAEAIALAREMGATTLLLSALQQQARLQLAAGDRGSARVSLDEAETLLPTHTTAEALAIQRGLQGRLALADGQADVALLAVEALVASLLAPSSNARLNVPLWVQAMVLDILEAAADPRRAVLLRSAQATLRARSDRIPDAEVRASYHAIQEHRPLL